MFGIKIFFQKIILLVHCNCTHGHACNTATVRVDVERKLLEFELERTQNNLAMEYLISGAVSHVEVDENNVPLNALPVLQ